MRENRGKTTDKGERDRKRKETRQQDQMVGFQFQEQKEWEVRQKT